MAPAHKKGGGHYPFWRKKTIKRATAFITQTEGNIMVTKGAKGLLVVVTLVLVTLAAVSSDAQAQGRNENPGVFPPKAQFGA